MLEVAVMTKESPATNTSATGHTGARGFLKAAGASWHIGVIYHLHLSDSSMIPGLLSQR